MEDTLRIYEHVPEELDEVLPFRNAVFGHVSREHWQAMNCTAVVAREDERLVGFIPLQFREQCLNSHVTIPVVYENAVGVAQEMRGRGIGTQMMDKAARFISDRVDAMMVVRGGERTDGYRFYRKAGHGDLMYARRYALPVTDCTSCTTEDVPGKMHVSPVDRDRWLALEPATLALHDRQYGRFGGGQRRKPGYWRMILDGHVYRDWAWRLFALWRDGDHLAGYMVAVDGQAASSSDLFVYEVVGDDVQAVEWLIRHACHLVRTSVRSGQGESADALPGQVVLPSISLANPVCALLHRMGFAEEASTPHIMARLLCPDRIFLRLAKGSDLVQDLALTVATPHRSLVVNNPPEPRYAVQLETKESLLSRLFFCRLDLASALDMELVRWNGHDAGLRRALCQVFAFAEWVQWFTDYV
jgi:GNAT superfamily N-acetyltransferase